MENQQSLQEQTAQEQTAQEQTAQEQTAQEQAAQEQTHQPVASKQVVQLRSNIAAEAELKRKQQALVLQRERILSERTSSPHRRSALGAALLEIEEKLGELGWTLHL